MRNSLRGLVFLSCIAAACGGGGLKSKVDDSIIADIPIREKQGVLDAQQEVDRAQVLKREAQAQIDSDERDLTVAKAGREQAGLEIKQVQAGFELARKRGNRDRISMFERRLQVAQLGQEAADLRVQGIERRRDYHRAQVDAAEERVRFALARTELAKAELARAQNRRINNDLSVGNFQEQVARAQQRMDEADQKAAAVQREVVALDQRYAQQLTLYHSQLEQVPDYRPSFQLPTLQANAPSSPNM